MCCVSWSRCGGIVRLGSRCAPRASAGSRRSRCFARTVRRVGRRRHAGRRWTMRPTGAFSTTRAARAATRRGARSFAPADEAALLRAARRVEVALERADVLLVAGRRDVEERVEQRELARLAAEDRLGGGGDERHELVAAAACARAARCRASGGPTPRRWATVHGLSTGTSWDIWSSVSTAAAMSPATIRVRRARSRAECCSDIPRAARSPRRRCCRCCRSGTCPTPTSRRERLDAGPASGR